jgi:HEPN domain-containing protein
MKRDTERWVRRAEEDMGMADAGWERGYSSACVFHCQQAVEKLLKASLIEKTGQYPKIHDLPRLARKLVLGLSEEQMRFLAKLSEMYIPTRYEDEWVEIPVETAENYYRDAKDLYLWLLQQLK